MIPASHSRPRTTRILLKAFICGLLTEGILFALVIMFGKWSPCNPENWVSAAWLAVHIPAFYVAQWLHLEIRCAYLDECMLINVVFWAILWYFIFYATGVIIRSRPVPTKVETPPGDSTN